MKGNISTVLIVANDNSFQTGLRTLLEQGGGFDFCIEARSGSQAIEKVRHLLPNLVILDFLLPDMNGLQLAQELRKIMPRLPIFMLTADRDLHAEKDALSSGINAVFSKVEDLETLVANARAVRGMK
jgi:DNA-binding NarL/FixJ family response regulator